MPSNIKILSFGPKEFTQGISPLQRQQNSTGGFFSQATSIDVYRYPGMISPGMNPTATAISGAPFYSLTYVNSHVVGSTNTAFWKTIDGTPTNAHTFNTYVGVGTVSYPHSILPYFIGSTVYTAIFTDDGFTLWDNGANFYDQWNFNGDNAGHTPAGGTNPLNTAVHRAVVFNKLLYYTDDTRIGVFDGTTGTYGTMTYSKLALPPNMHARDIRVVNGQIEIYADDTQQAYVIPWDGVNLPDDYTKVDDINMKGAITVNGFPYVLTTGKNFNPAVNVRAKNFYGYPSIATITDSNNSFGNNVNPSTIDSFNGMLMVADTGESRIYSYGTPFPTYAYREDTSTTFPQVLNSPIFSSGTCQAMCVAPGGVYVGTSTGVNVYNLSSDPANYTFDTNAAFKTNFIDLPNDSTIEWIRFYVLPLSTGAAFTPTIHTDFNTSAFWTGTDLTSANLDANGKSKTYFEIGALCDNFAIGGSWANSSTTNSVIINRIDVGYTTK